MTKVDLNEAKAALSELLTRAQAGEEVVIFRDNAPVARLVPIGPTPLPRRPGRWKGLANLDDGFFDPLPESEVAGWGV